VLDPGAVEGSTREPRLLLYLVPATSDLLFIRFATQASTAAAFEPIFDAMAATIQFEGSGRPTGSGLDDHWVG
jgi:hypothetical protein